MHVFAKHRRLRAHHNGFTCQDEAISVRAFRLFKVVRHESEATGSPENPQREAVHSFASVSLSLPILPFFSTWTKLQAPPVPGTQRQVFQPTERPRSALEDTRGGGCWTGGWMLGKMQSITMNWWSRREGAGNTEGIGSVIRKGASRTSTRYFPLFDSIIAISRSYFELKKHLP